MSTPPLSVPPGAPTRLKLLPRLEAVVDRTAIPHTPALWADQGPARYPVDGNDVLGDCVVAGMFHLVESQWRRAHGNTGAGTPTDLVGTSEEAQAWYWAEVTRQWGQVAQTPPGPGLDPVNAYVDWDNYGMTVGGTLTHCAAAMSVGLTNVALLRWAAWAFAGLGVAVSLPDDYGPAFTAPGPMKPSGPPNPANGHFVAILGFNATGPIIATWGALRQATWPWVQTYGQYGVAAFSDLWAEVPGLDWMSLECEMHLLGGWPWLA